MPVRKYKEMILLESKMIKEEISPTKKEEKITSALWPLRTAHKEIANPKSTNKAKVKKL